MPHFICLHTHTHTHTHTHKDTQWILVCSAGFLFLWSDFFPADGVVEMVNLPSVDFMHFVGGFSVAVINLWKALSFWFCVISAHVWGRTAQFSNPLAKLYIPLPTIARLTSLYKAATTPCNFSMSSTSDLDFHCRDFQEVIRWFGIVVGPGRTCWLTLGCVFHLLLK